jgi:hypothetical protein
MEGFRERSEKNLAFVSNFVRPQTTNVNMVGVRYQHMTGRIEFPPLAAKKQQVFQGFRSDDFEPFELPTPEQKLEQRGSDLRKGLTNRQRLFLSNGGERDELK